MRYFTLRALLILLLLSGHSLLAQWGPPYANSWIDYTQPYVKIGIQKKGLHRIPLSSLPKGFPVNTPEKFQLWRRGKEVSIISTANQEIVFYAVPNDGASDSLLYRPMSSRVNPYYSLYGDEGAYFLTIADKPGKRAKVVNDPINENASLLTHHNEHMLTVFQQDYSLGTKSSVNPGFFNSFFELGASRTGEVYKEGTDLLLNFKLEDLAGISQHPIARLLLHGRSNNGRKIEIYVGKSKNTLRLVEALDNSGFAATEYAFEIKPDDMDSGKNGVLSIRSVSGERLERFSLTYYSIEYPRQIKIGNKPSMELRLGEVSEKWNRLSVKGVSPEFKFLDISDVDHPVVLKRAGESLMVPREPGKRLILLATSEMIEVAPAKMKDVNFNAYDRETPNYIIITTEQLRAGATAFAAYRASHAGGSLKPTIFEIQDIYNQFNYGEPSPVAIKKFMAYMLANGIKDKYLFLIGKSISQNERMIRELPGEVPTIGFPGSDALLVEGIAGAPLNVPAIPVGRLSAVANENITDYLQKVKAYEASEPGESGWRKNVLHLSGGKTTGEIVELRENLRALEPMVVKGVMGGTVKAYVKKQPTEEVEPIDVTRDVNEGVGMITFFGHGSTLHSDPDIGYARDNARGYHNLNKYPVMYFNGCGIGNVFSNRFNAKPATPNAGDRITLSLDWLVAPDRGAIAIIACSFESFVSPGLTYLHSLYHHMFENPATAGLPIGEIQLAVAHDILGKYEDKYNIAYVHQSLLQGDPALRLLTTAEPDYAVEADEGITLLSDSGNKTIGESDSLRINIALVNFGRFTKGQIVPVEVVCSGMKGTDVRKVNVNAFASQQILKVSFPNEKNLKSIKVQIDPGQTLKELTRDNNVSELQVNWNLVKDKGIFSNKSSKDNIPPILTVKTGGRFLKQEERILPNPSFRISLSDDKTLSPDTTLIDIFIKPCKNNDCDFERIVYSGNSIKMLAIGGSELVFDYSTVLGPGKYEMMVNARDRTGNALTEPYRMHFEIVRPEEMEHSLVVSPNPATSYLRFELKAAKFQALKSVRYLIYDQRGNKIDDKSLKMQDNSSTMEWYWAAGNIMPGLYSYKVILAGEGNVAPVIRTGKVILQP